MNGKGIIIRRDQIKILANFKNGQLDGLVQILLANKEKINIVYRSGKIDET